MKNLYNSPKSKTKEDKNIIDSSSFAVSGTKPKILFAIGLLNRTNIETTLNEIAATVYLFENKPISKTDLFSERIFNTLNSWE